MRWEEFFTDNHIEWVSRGPNTKRGEVSIRCPWCGDDDPSQHLGVSLLTENWGCLRNPTHRGHTAQRLIAALLGCSKQQARLTERQYSAADPDTLDAVIKALEVTPDLLRSVAPEPLPDFREIKAFGTTQRFYDYLQKRGYMNVPFITKLYDLSCCTTGPFKDRIIFPFHHGGELLAWSGRSIGNPKDAPRYLSSKLVKTTIFNFDVLKKAEADILFITEGPFDAMKMDYFGNTHGARATCCSGTQITMSQFALLNTLRKNFRKVILLFDADAIESAANAVDWIQGSLWMGVPDGRKDPGEMNEHEIRWLIEDNKHS